MQLEFKHQELEKLYRERGYTHQKMPASIHKSYVKTCLILESMTTPDQLNTRKALYFKKYQDHYSVRINKQWRIEFDIDSVGNLVILTIRDANNHYKKNF